MPHNRFYYIPRAAVVKPVLMSRAYLGQSPSPQRSGPAPASPDIIHHLELMLHEIRIRPDRLVRIFRKAGITVTEEIVRVIEFIRPGLPRRPVTGGAAYLTEKLAASLDDRVIKIPCRRNCLCGP